MQDVIDLLDGCGWYQVQSYKLINIVLLRLVITLSQMSRFLSLQICNFTFPLTTVKTCQTEVSIIINMNRHLLNLFRTLLTTLFCRQIYKMERNTHLQHWIFDFTKINGIMDWTRYQEILGRTPSLSRFIALIESRSSNPKIRTKNCPLTL